MTIRQELTELADVVSKQVERTRAKTLEPHIEALRKQCDIAVRAWSGSNIGYHANVYWQGLQPTPPGCEFNPEWGLMDAYGTNHPADGWEIMDPAQVTQEILARAHIGDLQPIRREMKALREQLSDLKEQSISMLNVVLRGHDDTFFKRQLGHIEPLTVAAPPTSRQPCSVTRNGPAIPKPSPRADASLRTSISLRFTSPISIPATVLKPSKRRSALPPPTLNGWKTSP